MKELITTYFGGNRVDDPNTYYLFVVPGFTPSNVQGYMPRGRNVGFVSDVSARNIAHELGHGAFGLRHTFDEQPESKSNLLDYGSESYLTAAQWQQIQNPGIILNWFDEIEDAMSQTVIAYALCIENTSAFKGKVFNIYQEGNKKLKANTEPYAFTVDGQLYSFKVDGKIYVPYKNYSGHWGYALKGISPIESDKYTFEVANGAVAVNVQIQQQPSATTLRLDATVYTPSTCFEVIDVNWLSEAGRAKLSSQLKALGATNTEITIKECGKPTAHTVTAVSTTATQGQKDIQIELCWDGKKWNNAITQFNYSTTTAQAKGITNIAQAGESAKGAAQNALDNNQGIKRFSKTTTAPDGFTHEFTVGSADALESAVYFLETGKYLIENLEVPPESWQGGGPSKKVLSIPPVLGGGTDQGLAEVKDLKQMVDLGVAFVKEPESTLNGIWDGITGMTWEDAASVAFGDWADRYKNYEKGNPYDWYQGGRDGVSVVKYFAAGGIFTISGGIKEMPAELKKKFDNISDLWRGIVSKTDNLLGAKVASIKTKYPNSKVGYRGSLANGAKYNKDFKKRGGDEYLPFKPDDWDVDAFIVDDALAAKFDPSLTFRDVRRNGIDTDLKNICDDLDDSFKLENGYRIETNKPFTFAVWTTQEFENKIKDYGYKLLE